MCPKPTFTNDDFLLALDNNKGTVTAKVIEKVGCSRDTALRFLTKLERLGYVKKVAMGSTRPHGDFFSWIRVPTEKESDKVFINMVNTFEDEYGISDLATLVKNIINSKDGELKKNIIVLVRYLEDKRVV